MSKRIYRSSSINKVSADALTDPRERDVIVGIDIAKRKQFAAFGSRAGTDRIVHWIHPEETPAFVAVCSELALSRTVEIVMEPSGTYGDSIRYQLTHKGLPVFRIQPKHTADASELLDGVPSIHDAKSAVIIARLHSIGISSPWPFKSDAQRDLKARLRLIELHSKQAAQSRNRLESLTAAHWPELTKILDLRSATLLELLMEFPDPRTVSKSPKKVATFMRKVGRHNLADEKIEGVIRSASTTLGAPMTPVECEVLAGIAGEARRNQQLAKLESLKLADLVGDNPSMAPLKEVLGLKTAAVVLSSVGDPRAYSSAKALVKALGLNLRTRSSGTCRPGRLQLSKRGPGVARQMLYMAALRRLHHDPVVQAWYQKKVARSPGSKRLATVAVMRKLALALWHVARGSKFDSRKLFDVTRLELGPLP